MGCNREANAAPGLLSPQPAGLKPFVDFCGVARAGETTAGIAQRSRLQKSANGIQRPSWDLISASLGGARPKSAVILRDGQLAIAKFPKPDDTMDIAAGEILAMTLAKKAGITVAGHQLVEVGGKNVAVIERFDRSGVRRTPFLSASSLLALPKEDPGSYTLMADVIRQFGDDVQKDLQEMWRRLAFSLLASNYDDHLRNHAFLMHRARRWSLSPAYDLNPVPAMDRSAMTKTPISEGIQETSIDAALSAASRFGLSVEEAKKVLREVLQSVTAWREVGKSLGIRASVLGNYESAFENSLVEEAIQLLKN